MAIPTNFIKLREALDNLPELSRQTKSGGLDQRDPKFNHLFSEKEANLKLLSVHPGHVEAEQKTDTIKHTNSQGTLHGGVSMTAADAVMAAAAQSTIGKAYKNKIAVVKDFAQRFFKPVLPGAKLTYVSNIIGANDDDNIKFIQTEIREGQGSNTKIIGKAISSYFIVEKSDHLTMAA